MSTFLVSLFAVITALCLIALILGIVLNYSEIRHERARIKRILARERAERLNTIMREGPADE